MEQIRKHSKKRDAILKTIQSTLTHPTAMWVYEQLKPTIPDLSLATVYRNIKLFQRDGSVASVGVVDGEERFDGFVTPHPHFVCEQCGSVFDLDFSDTSLPCPSAEHVNGFDIDYRRTTYFGVCAKCKTS